MQFAEAKRIRIQPGTFNVNLEVYDNADGFSGSQSSCVAKGIRDVIAGKVEAFVMDYPYHAPDEKCWFYKRVTRADGPAPHRIVVRHENITALKLAEEQLGCSKEVLRLEKRKLEDANTALKVFLQQRDKDQRQLENDILENIRRLVEPLFERIDRMKLTERARLCCAVAAPCAEA